jgi:ribonuclease E
MGVQTMTKRMLIDGAHAEELRVVITEDEKIQDFEVETTGKAQLKGNIYVAEVSRVEPSLQAAFITYGANRNGFLAFGELHPSFFDVPEKEKSALLQELEDIAERRNKSSDSTGDDDAPEEPEEANTLSEEEMDEDARALALANQMDSPDDLSAKKVKGKKTPSKKGGDERQAPIHRRYRINEVLKPGQKILVQVVKEERGNKGAALTTFFTLPGRYTVLMPNTPYAGGISRKINDSKDRQALKKVYDGLKVPASMGLIIRTAGVGQAGTNIKKDFKNLTTIWKDINKEFEKETNQIRCVHEDGSVIIRALRDMAKDDLEEIIIEGKRIYKTAKDFAKTLMPDTAKLIKEHKGDTPLFIDEGIEAQLNSLHHTRVPLPSGGYLMIHPTEALVAVDVNSGSATQERNIEETALKTNMEAVEELARQIRLRDLAGLIVIDFIDMDETRNTRAVERAMRKAARRDRARLQVESISSFGLMEISRQRLRPSFVESHYIMCSHCNGTGQVHSLASSALMVLRRLEEEDAQEADRLIVTASPDLVVYILNHKRSLIQEMEAKYKYQILFRTDDQHMVPDFRLDLVRIKADGSETSQTQEVVLREQAEQPPEVRYRKQNRRGGRRGTGNQGSKKHHANSRDDSSQNQPEAQAKQRRSTPDKKGNAESAPKRPRRASSQAKPSEATPTKSVEESRAPVRAKRAEKSPEKPPAAAKTPKVSPRKKAVPVKDQPLVVEHVEADGQTAPKSEKAGAGGTFQRWWSKG